MDAEVLTRLSKFQLKENEEEGVVLVQHDIKNRTAECERSLLGQIWGQKDANYTGLKNTLFKLWCPDGEMKTVELGPNYFQFTFSRKEEMDRVLLKRPWHFDNQILVLQPWKPQLKQDDASFRRCSMWIHIKGLPNHWVSKEVGWKIGKLFIHCRNVVIPESGSRSGRLMKILVDIDLGKPLMRGTKIKLEEELLWVDFTYEKLPTFYFYCGIIGHQEKNCDTKCEDAEHQTIVEGQYGEWMRVQGVGGKEKLQCGTRSKTNHNSSKRGGGCSRILR